MIDEKQLKRLVKLGYVSPEGIIYDEELAGSNGMNFYLFVSREHTPEDVDATVDWLKYSRDVVSITIYNILGKHYPITRNPPIWTPERRESELRKIVSTRSAQPVEDCVLVDLYTASLLVQVIDSLSPANKEKMLSFKMSREIDIMWQILESRDEK